MDSASYNDFKGHQFIATDRLDNKITIEFMMQMIKMDFFIVITDKKNEIVMYLSGIIMERIIILSYH